MHSGGNVIAKFEEKKSSLIFYTNYATTFITDKKMPRKLKVKLYMTVIRPILLYGAEC